MSLQLSNSERFLNRNFSAILAPACLLLFGLAMGRVALDSNSESLLLPLKGHLKTLEVASSNGPDSSAFNLRFREFPQSFFLPQLKDVDRMLLEGEEKGTEFQFSVLEKDYRNPNLFKLTLQDLASKQNTYLSSGDVAGLLGKSRGLAGLLATLCLGCAGLFALRLRSRFLKEAKEETPEIELFDPFLVWGAHHPFKFAFASSLTLLILLTLLFPGGFWVLVFPSVCDLLWIWLKLRDLKNPFVARILESERLQIEAQGPRPETEAPTDVKAVEFLLKSPGGVDRENDLGQTALHVASAAGRAEAVDLLLRNNAGINKRDHEGKTPLILAAARSHLGVVLKLVERGADVTVVDASGNTALSYAQQNQKEALVKVLSRAAQERPKILAAAAAGKLDLVTQLVKSGADLNTRDAASGETALMFAVRGDFLGVARKLLELGADPTVQNRAGETALAIAEKGKSREMLALMKNPPKPPEKPSETP